MTFGAYPGAMNAFGLRIDSMMNGFTAIPAFLALGTMLVPRFGPTVPVVPAAASVWQLPQPADPVKTAFPAAALVCDAELPPELVPLVLLELPALPAPGTPGWTALGGGVPTGGGPLGFCELSHFWNASGLTTRTAARISEWPAPHSSVHSTG